MKPLLPPFLLFSTANAFSPIASTRPPLPSSPYITSSIHKSDLKPTARPSPPLTQGITHQHYTRTPTALFSSKQQREFLYKKRCATLFAFLTGWADYLLFLKYRFFSTMMTGNSMWMAAALVESRYRDVAFYITVIFSYIFGVATFRRVELEWKEDALNTVLAPIVMGFLVGSDLLTKMDAGCRWVPAVMLAYAWGIINSGECLM
jgi:hypothetical protein